MTGWWLKLNNLAVRAVGGSARCREMSIGRLDPEFRHLLASRPALSRLSEQVSDDLVQLWEIGLPLAHPVPPFLIYLRGIVDYGHNREARRRLATLLGIESPLSRRLRLLSTVAMSAAVTASGVLIGQHVLGPDKPIYEAKLMTFEIDDESARRLLKDKQGEPIRFQSIIVSAPSQH